MARGASRVWVKAVVPSPTQMLCHTRDGSRLCSCRSRTLLNTGCFSGSGMEMEPRGCWVEFAVSGKDCSLLFIFLFYFPPYTELWPPLSSASVYVTPQYWKLPLSLTPYPRSEPTDCTFSDCKAPSGMGSGFGSRHSVGLAGSGEPWHLESRLDSHGYRFSVPLLRLAAMSHKA